MEWEVTADGYGAYFSKDLNILRLDFSISHTSYESIKECILLVGKFNELYLNELYLNKYV